ncbi:hypothetical protein BDZ45DRAFT_305714 [Acephala macrosclerotiorum]|nr:hypothetical protein BDZ45DRAFT_305714 [Acephala macrosclerotiorum]
MSTGFSQPSSRPSQQDVQISLGDSLNTQLFVLFGVHRTGPTLQLAQLDTKQYTNDGAFFRDLRQKYKKMRGRWRFLFSVWRLRYCDFVKFEKIRANRIIHRGKDVPTDPKYEYTPHPPHAEIPPISPHEFELAFTSCSSECPFSKLHDCVESPNGNFAIERIPKRRGALEVQVGSAEFAWSI